MNEELLSHFIKQAMGSEEIRQALSRDPVTVLTKWGFTPEEVTQLEIRIEQGVSLEELGERVTKYLFGGGGPG